MATIPTKEFAGRSKERAAEMRSLLTRLKASGSEIVGQLAKIEREHAADRRRTYDKLSLMADDDDALQDEAARVEEIGGLLDVYDLGQGIADAIDDAYAVLKSATSSLASLSRL